MLQDMGVAKDYLYIVIFCILLVSFPILGHIILFHHSPAVAQTTLMQLTPTTYVPYNNSAYGIRIQYPDNWQNTEEKIVSPPNNTNDTVLLARFMPHDQSVNVAISIEKLLQNVTLDQYIGEYIVLQNDTRSNFQLVVLNKTTTLGGTPGYKLLYNVGFDFTKFFDLPARNMTIMEFIAVHGDNTYHVAYTNLLRPLEEDQNDRGDKTAAPLGSGVTAKQTNPQILKSGLKPGLQSGLITGDLTFKLTNPEGLKSGLKTGLTTQKSQSMQHEWIGLPQEGGSDLANTPVSPAPSDSSDMDEQFLGHLPAAQKMIDSFEITR